MNTNIKQIVDKVRLGDAKSIKEAATAALGLNNVSVGSTVAVVDDPTFPYAGLSGKVKSIDNGMATVAFDNGNEVPLQVNQLLAL